ncbi:MAG: EamA family transporter [Acidobacteriota bacterium]
MTTAHHTRRAWLAWFAICLIWGTTYLAIKVALVTIPPLLVGGFRYLLAAAIMLVGLRVQGRRLPPPSAWPTQAVLGFFMLALGNGGVVTGEGYLSSGLTAVLVATSPFWMVGIDALYPGGARLHARHLIGMCVGFGGIVMLVWPDLSLGGVSGRNMLLGVIAVQVACIGWSLASSYTKRHVTSGDVLGAATLQMLFGGAFMTLGGTLRGEWAHLSFTMPSALALLYLTLLGSVVAFVAYSYALKHLPIAVVSLYTYVNPIIAVALGIFLLHEPFDLRQLAAAAVIAVGMLIVRPGKAPEGEVS